MNEKKLSQIMENLGFLVLEDNGVEIYMLETRYYYLVIEPTTRNNQTTYGFVNYSYNKNKGETRINKCYFEGFNENTMLKEVGSYMTFMLEKGYLKTNNKQILPFAKEISKRKIFV